FFQAEDGIRYLIVTGVQTCALPILSEPDLARYKSESQRKKQNRKRDRKEEYRIGFEKKPCWRNRSELGRVTAWVRFDGDRLEARSEERRVGKEGRCRGSRCHSHNEM